MDTHIAAFSTSDGEPEGRRATISLPGEAFSAESTSEPDIGTVPGDAAEVRPGGGRFAAAGSFVRGSLSRFRLRRTAAVEPELSDDAAAPSEAALEGSRHSDTADAGPSVTASANDKLASHLVEPASPGEGRHRSSRRLLMAGSAVIVMAGGVAFLASPYNPLSPSAAIHANGDRMTASAVQTATAAAPVVAPAAKVARAPQDSRPSLVLPNPPIQTPTDQFNEIVKLRRPTAPAEEPVEALAKNGRGTPDKAAGPILAAAAASTRPETGRGVTPPASALSTSAPPAVPTVAVAAVSNPVAMEVGSLETGIAADMGHEPSPSAGEGQAATPVATTPVAPAAPASVPLVIHGSKPIGEKPAERRSNDDPVVIATALHPSAMTAPEQVEVLNLVAKLGTLISDMKIKDAAMQARIEAAASRADAAVADFDRRLALAEARGSITAAMGGEQPAPAPVIGSSDARPEAAAIHPAKPRVVAVASSTSVGAAATDVGLSSAAPRYRVTAASPGLAMLSPLDRSGGDGAQPLQVAVGDQVPGYGRILSIQQRGSAWIVQTDRGPDKGAIQ